MQGPTIALIRRVYAFFGVALLALTAVALAIVDFGAVDSLTEPVALTVPVAAAIGVAVVSLLGRKQLVASTDEQARANYMVLFVLRVAFAETPALLGVVASFVLDASIAALWGLALAAVPYVLAAPSDRDLDHRQDQLRAAGSSVDLRAALRS